MATDFAKQRALVDAYFDGWNAVPRPSRIRLALVMIAVAYVLVLSRGQLAGPTLAAAPPPVQPLVTIVIEVFLMKYVLVPRRTRWLARWTYPKKEAS